MKRLRLYQLQPRLAPVLKKTFPFPQHQWVDQQAVFIHEIMVHQRLHKNTTASYQDGLTRLLLQLGNLFCKIPTDPM